MTDKRLELKTYICRSIFKIIRVVLVSFFTITVSATSAHAFCFSEASLRYQVNEYVLMAIARHESRMNPNLILRNTNGSLDLGLMGINTVHLASSEPLYRAGMNPQMLMDPCTNVMTGAYLLRLKMEKFGNTWQAVGSYHSTTDVHNARYQRQIWEMVQRVQKQIALANSAAERGG